MPKPLILASQSPYRKQLMLQLGFDFECVSPKIDERETEKNHVGSLSELPEFLAREKAMSVAELYPDQVVIGSDQLLVFANRSFHKPKNIDEVVERLEQLQGKTHELHTGICLVKGEQIQSSTCVAKMTMRPLSLQDIRTYAALDTPVGCAGGYKIEQRGALLFTSIETSDYHSIVGLPVLSLTNMLQMWQVDFLPRSPLK